MNLPTPQNIDLLTAISVTKPKLPPETKTNPFGATFDSELKSVLSEAPLLDATPLVNSPLVASPFASASLDQPILEREGLLSSGNGRLSQLDSPELESRALFGIIKENVSEIVSPITSANAPAVAAFGAGLPDALAVIGASDTLTAQIVTGKPAPQAVLTPAPLVETIDQRLFASQDSRLDSLIPMTKDQEGSGASLLKNGQAVNQQTALSEAEFDVAMESKLNSAIESNGKSQPAIKTNGATTGNIADRGATSESAGKIDISQFSSQSQPTIAIAPMKNPRPSKGEAKLVDAASSRSVESADEETFDSHSIISEQSKSNKSTGTETQGNPLANRGDTPGSKILSQKINSAAGKPINAEIENISASESATVKIDSAAIRPAQSTDGAGRLENPSGVKFELPEHLSSAVSKGVSSISLKISPRHLGDAKLTLKIVQGIVSGTLLVETAAAKLAVESSLDSLIEKLADEDIALDRLDVEVNGRERRGAGGHERFGEFAHQHSETEEGATQDNQYQADSVQSLIGGASGISSIAVDTFA